LKNILLIPLILLVLHVNAQYDPSKINKKAEAMYTRGLEKAAEGDMTSAISLLNNAIRSEPAFEEAFLSLGGVYAQLKDYPSSVANYEKAKAIDSFFFKDYALPYSISLAGTGAFDKALAAVDLFLTMPGLNPSGVKAGTYRKQCYSFALDFARRQNTQSYKFEPHNLGDSINSPVSEYFPTITIDGEQLIYTRRVNNVNEDFYSSSLQAGKWKRSKTLEGNINSALNEGAQNISQDGEWLIFTGCAFPDGFGSCDLYISYHTPDGWSEPENLGRRINSESWDSAPSLSPDKRDLYFSSTRPDGYGQADIYISHRQMDGSWSVAENAGPQINTAGNESSPFIHADNQTLYFTSTGHVGYGGDDLFVARKKAQGQWTDAQNLGYPINTIEDEGSLVVAANGTTAYFASDRSDSRGGLDIYSFELRADIRPAKTLWVNGKVLDSITRKGLPSMVELKELSTNEVMSRIQTDETGNYLITLPVGKDYAFNVKRKGYLFFSDNFLLSKNAPDSTYKIDIPLQPIQTDASVILKNIFFGVNQSVLEPESFPELDNVISLLKDNPTVRISINGHTDNTGSEADNLKLSRERAKAVVVYLTGKGIAPTRLTSQGFGASKPIASNSSEQGKAINRRTEMKVIK
jgi:outer membrane protein OmpA-like peptidoglycan-associated protein/tetratricopeptide (TPR) repeat protein